MLKRELAHSGLAAEVTGRPKHIYSIHRKAQHYTSHGKQFDDIHDLFAVRVIVPAVQDCYAALGVVHALWHPLPGLFDDYIANPKANMYQSIHTTVRCIGGVPIEVQVRTHGDAPDIGVWSCRPLEVTRKAIAPRTCASRRR